MQEDAQLVEQTLAGDEQSFHCLIMKYYNPIHALVLSKIGSHEDAKDITQDVFFSAYRELGSLRRPERFRQWLQQIARNHCKNWFRRSSFFQLHENMAYEIPSAEELLILRETMAKVIQAMDELPEQESRLLRERYLDEASYDELKASHGLSYNALATRLFRAKQRVREKVGKLMSFILPFQRQHLWQKILTGGIETMKVSMKVKVVSVGVVGFLVLGGAGVFVWRNQQYNQSSTTDSIAQNVEKPRLPVGQTPSKETVASKTISKPLSEPDELPDEIEQDKIVRKTAGNSDMTGANTDVPVEPKTPAEILEKYNDIISSPSFMAEARGILISGKLKIDAHAKRVEELRNRKTELENDLQNSSGHKIGEIENELAKTRDEIWNTRVNMQRQIILDDDAYSKLKLRYITLEEIRIAQQEIRKSPSPFPTGGDSKEDELDVMARTEALRQLKAEGWTPNPLRSYQ